MADANPDEIPSALAHIFDVASADQTEEAADGSEEERQAAPYRWAFISPLTVTIPAGRVPSEALTGMISHMAQMVEFPPSDLESILGVLSQTLSGVHTSLEEEVPVRMRFDIQRLHLAASITLIGQTFDFMKSLILPDGEEGSTRAAKEDWVRSQRVDWEAGDDMQGAMVILSLQATHEAAPSDGQV
ncbi:MAG: hypothetical protein ACYTGH_19310 [Planctomycetota bacterium]|jgi:hypothetical protein